jgi:hypothetical protein
MRRTTGNIGPSFLSCHRGDATLAVGTERLHHPIHVAEKPGHVCTI